MTTDERPRLARVLAVLGETFNEPVSDLRAEGYYEALKDLEMAAIEKGARSALRHAKFFPRPVELRELAEGSVEDRATVAWGGVLEEIRRVGYLGAPDLDQRTLAAVLLVWGSWKQLCCTLPAEGPELIGWMKKFHSAYSTVDHHHDRQAIIGRDEAKSIHEHMMKRLGSGS